MVIKEIKLNAVKSISMIILVIYSKIITRSAVRPNYPNIDIKFFTYFLC